MGRMGENCSYFFAERRFGETDAMGRNTGNYQLSDFCHCLLKPKKPKFEQDTVRRLKPSQSPLGQRQQGDKKQSVCCFRRWQGVQWYSEPPKTKHSNFKSTSFLSFRRKLRRGTFRISFCCASNRLFFAPLAKINYDL